jgi:hypothetical protein
VWNDNDFWPKRLYPAAELQIKKSTLEDRINRCGLGRAETFVSHDGGKEAGTV